MGDIRGHRRGAATATAPTIVEVDRRSVHPLEFSPAFGVEPGVGTVAILEVIDRVPYPVDSSVAHALSMRPGLLSKKGTLFLFLGAQSGDGVGERRWSKTAMISLNPRIGREPRYRPPTMANTE